MITNKNLKNLFIAISIIVFFHFTNLYSIDEHKDYLGGQYSKIKPLLNKIQHPVIQKLSDKIIKEARTKQVSPQEILVFFEENQAHFLLIQKWFYKYKINELELADNLFEFLRNGFDNKTLALIMEKHNTEKFREKLSKTLYFFIYYINHDILENGDANDFNNEQASQIAYSVFVSNPPISYLNQLVEAVQQLKYRRFNYVQATMIICQMVLSKKPVKDIVSAIPELPEE